MKKVIILFTNIFLCVTSIYAQEKEVFYKDSKPIYIKLKKCDTTYKIDDSKRFLKNELMFKSNLDFEKIKSFRINDQDKYNHEKFQQYYKGIKIEGASYLINSFNNNIVSANGFFVDSIDINIKPLLNEKQALDSALAFTNAKLYFWEDTNMENNIKKKGEVNATYFSKSDLVIIPDKISSHDENKYTLAYKFKINSIIPSSKNIVYVDAHSGKIISSIPVIRTTLGHADTRYSDNRDIETQLNNGTNRLRDVTRGNGINTFDLDRSDVITNRDFLDADNNWTTVEWDNAQFDNAALDAHWGAMMTYDYFNQIHNRNSYDGAGATINQYVHYRFRDSFGNLHNMDNAGWDPEEELMIYGDGDVIFFPLTSIDVIAHELAHGVEQYTSGLDYELQSGAINESFSDIWSACIQFYAAPEKDPWIICEEIMQDNTALRSLSNPNQFDQPDTYLGTNWVTTEGCIPICNLADPYYNDCCGVHTNSGVLNYWFYLLTVGGDEIENDFNIITDIVEVGLEDAEKIVYATENLIASTSATFEDVRIASMEAVNELFPNEFCPQVVSVNNAWRAVHVGENLPMYSILEGNISSLANYTFDIDIPIKGNFTYSGTISNNADVTFNTVGTVTLNSGFSISLGSSLEINICNCQ